MRTNTLNNPNKNIQIKIDLGHTNWSSGHLLNWMIWIISNKFVEAQGDWGGRLNHSSGLIKATIQEIGDQDNLGKHGCGILIVAHSCLER